MSMVTKNVAEYVRKKAINLSKMSRDTGIPYSSIYGSLANGGRERDLRDDEFIRICIFLNIDPRKFADKEAVGGK